MFWLSVPLNIMIVHQVLMNTFRINRQIIILNSLDLIQDNSAKSKKAALRLQMLLSTLLEEEILRKRRNS